MEPRPDGMYRNALKHMPVTTRLRTESCTQFVGLSRAQLGALTETHELQVADAA